MKRVPFCNIIHITMKFSFYNNIIKRLLDIIISACALIILAIPMAVLAALVKTKLGSPVIFHQDRPGRKDPKTGQEKIFRLYKFRSMTDARDPSGLLLPDEQRLPAFGRRLRATSFDELPELWNILKGDMSLVGPRPLMPQYLPRYTEEQRHRHDVRPGLTGLAQVNGRNATTWEQRFKYDVEYVNNVSFVNDIKIVFKTVKVVLSHEGISSETSATMEEFMGSVSDVDSLNTTLNS